jgi:malate synthase
VPGGTVTEAGVRGNVNVGLQYLNSWLSGNGAAAIFNLMEDVATAEISRSQLWQWIRNNARLSDGRPVTQALYETIRGEEIARLGGSAIGRLGEAAEILDGLVGAEEFPEFLTLSAYKYLE